MSATSDRPFARSIRSWRWLAVSLLLPLAACDEYGDRSDRIAAEFGDAVEINKITQITNPWPRAAHRKRIEFDGSRALLAQKRYKTNTSIMPTTKPEGVDPASAPGPTASTGSGSSN